MMQADQIQTLFTRQDGSFLCARWGRPIVPVVFGPDDATLPIIKGAIEAVARLARLPVADTDPELGANLMMFFFRDWKELTDVPDMERMIPEIGPLCARLEASGANQYRVFRFDPDGAIRAVFVFLRMDEHLAAQPAQDLALSQAAQAMLTWGAGAFSQRSPLALAGKVVVLRPDLAALIRAAYDPVLPAASQDPIHALRLSARITAAEIAAGIPQASAGGDMGGEVGGGADA